MPREAQSSAQRNVAPLLIGPANAEAAMGAPWRWVRRRAAELGVPVIGSGRKTFVRAADFIAALERGSAPDTNAPADPAEQVRAALGRARRVA